MLMSVCVGRKKKKKKGRKIRAHRLRYNKIIITRFLVRTRIAR